MKRYVVGLSLCLVVAGCSGLYEKPETEKEKDLREKINKLSEELSVAKKQLNETEREINILNARDAKEVTLMREKYDKIIEEIKKLEIENARLKATEDLRKQQLDLRELQLKELEKNREKDYTEKIKELEDKQAKVKKAEEELKKEQSALDSLKAKTSKR